MCVHKSSPFITGHTGSWNTGLYKYAAYLDRFQFRLGNCSRSAVGLQEWKLSAVGGLLDYRNENCLL